MGAAAAYGDQVQRHATRRHQVQARGRGRGVVCDQHGAAAPQVRRRAAERLLMTADEAAELLIRWMEDEVPFGVRAKIAQDLADRAGLAATQVHQIVPSTEDPVMRFFAERSATRATRLNAAARSAARDRELRDRSRLGATPRRRRSWKLRSWSQTLSPATTRRRGSPR